MSATATTAVYALVGRPVRHSLSPILYNALFAHLGVDAVYVAFDVAPERAPGLAAAIRTLDLRGVNLTVPHKSALLADLDAIAPVAARTGSVNVVVNREGRLEGDSTDGEGFARAVEEDGVSLADATVVVLGSGGAGRAVADAAAGRGAREVCLLNRTLASARDAAARLSASHPGTVASWGPLTVEGFAAVAGRADVIVQCTAGPGIAAVAALDTGVVPSGAAWVDLNYWMPDPPHAAALQSRGNRVLHGHGMLLHQALLAFERFTGHVVGAPEARRVLGSALPR